MLYRHRRLVARTVAALAAILGAGAVAGSGRASPQEDAKAPMKDESRAVLVTGANRGLGLACTKEDCDAGWPGYATAREPDKAEELQSLGERVHVVQLDVTDAASVAALAKGLEKQPIDLLINNAGAGVSIDGGPKLEKLKMA